MFNYRKKGSGAGKVIGILFVLIILAALVIFVLSKLGIFPFGGGGSSTGNGEVSTVSESSETVTDAVTETTEITEATTTTTAETTKIEITYLDVTVSGSEYNYQNRTYTDAELETMVDALKAAVTNDETVIRITDQDAALNAYTALTDALDGAALRYEKAAEQ